MTFELDRSRVGADVAHIADKIERTITANLRSCRNCTFCSNRTEIEPTCKKFFIKVPATNVKNQPVNIFSFCSVQRSNDGECGESAGGYELYVPPVTNFMGTKE